jgi:hypothetical protein
MRRKKWDPTSPEFIEAMRQRVRQMTREELLEELAWRPEGVEETWRLARDGASADDALAEARNAQAGQAHQDAAARRDLE